MSEIEERLRAVEAIASQGIAIERKLRIENERLKEFEGLVKHYQDRLRTIAKHPDTPEIIRQYAVGLLDSEGMPAPDFMMKP